MYLNHNQILQLIQNGEMHGVNLDNVNAASLDVCLGNEIYVEEFRQTSIPVDYRRRERLNMRRVELPDTGYAIRPGEFFLAHTVEKCNFADDTAALFRIKSSMGRIGLEHMDAGWVDPGFNGKLTLEFKNMTSYHNILLRPGDKIGQLIFFKGEPVNAEQSYRTRGNYNGAEGVMQVRYKEDGNDDCERI